MSRETPKLDRLIPHTRPAMLLHINLGRKH
jgi:hypothetical protein